MEAIYETNTPYITLTTPNEDSDIVMTPHEHDPIIIHDNVPTTRISVPNPNPIIRPNPLFASPRPVMGRPHTHAQAKAPMRMTSYIPTHPHPSPTQHHAWLNSYMTCNPPPRAIRPSHIDVQPTPSSSTLTIPSPTSTSTSFFSLQNLSHTWSSLINDGTWPRAPSPSPLPSPSPSPTPSHVTKTITLRPRAITDSWDDDNGKDDDMHTRNRWISRIHEWYQSIHTYLISIYQYITSTFHSTTTRLRRTYRDMNSDHKEKLAFIISSALGTITFLILFEMIYRMVGYYFSAQLRPTPTPHGHSRPDHIFTLAYICAYLLSIHFQHLFNRIFVFTPSSPHTTMHHSYCHSLLHTYFIYSFSFILMGMLGFIAVSIFAMNPRIVALSTLLLSGVLNFYALKFLNCDDCAFDYNRRRRTIMRVIPFRSTSIQPMPSQPSPSPTQSHPAVKGYVYINKTVTL